MRAGKAPGHLQNVERGIGVSKCRPLKTQCTGVLDGTYADESAATRCIATSVATNGPTVGSVSVITMLTYNEENRSPAGGNRPSNSYCSTDRKRLRNAATTDSGEGEEARTEQQVRRRLRDDIRHDRRATAAGAEVERHARLKGRVSEVEDVELELIRIGNRRVIGIDPAGEAATCGVAAADVAW